jgi:hypothetical protein
MAQWPIRIGEGDKDNHFMNILGKISISEMHRSSAMVVVCPVHSVAIPFPIPKTPMPMPWHETSQCPQTDDIGWKTKINKTTKSSTKVRRSDSNLPEAPLPSKA